MESVFRFKHFSLSHHHATMKVGTDALILGAWLPVADNCKRILDVGTGSGVIALMLAQRCPTPIQAIDIHEASVQEAAINFTNSPWGNQLTAIQSSLQNYPPPGDTKYDLIVSNPPFFQNSLLPQSPQFTLAKHNVSLSTHDFVAHTSRLLDDTGTWAVILPPDRIDHLLLLSVEFGFFLIHRLNVYTKANKALTRVIAVFSRDNLIRPKIDNLLIRNEAGAYTEAYKKLTQDYHAEGCL